MSSCAISNRASVGFGARDGDRPTRRDVLQGAPYCTIGASIALDRWPRLRSDVARRVGAEDWTGHFLYLTAESCMVALRDMAELQAVRQRPAVLRWRSSHLPDALGRLIGSMLVTPKGLAAQLGISLQAALGILWTLQAEGVVREVTGHASFRAFSLKL